MQSYGRMTRISSVWLAAAWLMVSNASGQEDVASLLAKISKGPVSQADLYKLEGYPIEPGTIAALSAAFDQYQDKQEKQDIAETLVRLGASSPRYFEFLAEYAREAVEDRTPFFAQVDAEGEIIKGQFNPPFENWCVQNGKDTKVVAAL